MHGTWIRYEQRLKEAAALAIPHTAFWYAARAKEFQFGDLLQATDGPVQYAVVDTSKRIINAAAVKELVSGAASILIIKVAKESGLQLTALSNAELTAFKGYINSIRDAGVVVQVVSQNADLLKLQLDIYYNAIVPIADIQANVEVAIIKYLKSLPFDGVFRVLSLVDAIQQVEGVVDIKTVLAEATTAYTTTPNYVPIDVFYETVAGYINVDPNFPLTSQINFIANV